MVWHQSVFSCPAGDKSMVQLEVSRWSGTNPFSVVQLEMTVDGLAPIHFQLSTFDVQSMVWQQSILSCPAVVHIRWSGTSPFSVVQRLFSVQLVSPTKPGEQAEHGEIGRYPCCSQASVLEARSLLKMPNRLRKHLAPKLTSFFSFSWPDLKCQGYCRIHSAELGSTVSFSELNTPAPVLKNFTQTQDDNGPVALLSTPLVTCFSQQVSHEILCILVSNTGHTHPLHRELWSSGHQFL